MSDDAQKIKAILGEFISKNALSDGIDTARIQENWSSIMWGKHKCLHKGRELTARCSYCKIKLVRTSPGAKLW